jgi:sialic acid synthase SpsE
MAKKEYAVGASRRSLHLLVAVKAGTILTESVIEYRRPGTGITPDTIELISGSRFRCDLPAGHQIQLSDLDFS